MEKTIWLTFIAMASGTTLIWWVLQMRIPMASGIAAFAWSYLAFLGGEVTTFDSGVAYTATIPYFQLFATGMAVLSLAALVLNRIGGYPPEDTEELESETDNRRSQTT